MLKEAWEKVFLGNLIQDGLIIYELLSQSKN